MSDRSTRGGRFGIADGRGRTILGIDPGTARTGYGLIEKNGTRLRALSYGLVRTPAGMPLHERLAMLFDELSGLLAEHRPDAAAVEALFFNVNVRTALAVGQARGVALLACTRAGCSLYEYTPQQVKQAVTGYGKADKAQIQEMVKTLLALPVVPKPDDVADALGVALCHASSESLLRRADTATRVNAQAGGGAAGAAKRGSARRGRAGS